MVKSKSDPESRFVTGNKATKTPKGKSLTPKTNSTKAGDKKRDGKFAKSEPY